MSKFIESERVKGKNCCEKEVFKTWNFIIAQNWFPYFFKFTSTLIRNWFHINPVPVPVLYPFETGSTSTQNRFRVILNSVLSLFVLENITSTNRSLDLSTYTELTLFSMRKFSTLSPNLRHLMQIELTPRKVENYEYPSLRKGWNYKLNDFKIKSQFGLMSCCSANLPFRVYSLESDFCTEKEKKNGRVYKYKNGEKFEI